MSAPIAVVTGASSGIGLAVARALVAAGHTVVGTSRDSSRVTPVPGVSFLDLDVSSPSSTADLVATVLDRHGRIDVLVNNAGIGSVGAAEESSVEQDRRLFDVNVLGVMRVTKAVLPHMREQGSGRVVTISSVLGLIPSPYMAAYAATKHAIEGWSESVDHELREFGVRAVLVEPFFTATSFETNSLRPDTPQPAYATRRRTAEDVVAAGVRSGDDPAVVAGAVLAAVTDATPKVRYAAGGARRVAALRRYVPAAAFDRSVRKLNRLPA